MDFIEELTWRGMIHQMMPGTEDELKKGMTAAYLGIDPTADSLHIGHLVGVMILKHFQRCGHKPIALIGGATGMIGDPSMKSQERKLLDVETLRHNQEAIRRQLAKFLDFDSDAPNAAILVNNYDWMKDYGFLDFIRDIGKCITVNYMMAKESVKKRLSGDSGQGMSFTEFSYQLLQGYDFLWLYRNKGCRLQLGGSDQWGNITTGTELIRRLEGADDAFALTCPLITKADGGKFGKTESGNVWLDPARTSPYQFYQFWLNVSDADAEKYIKIFTVLPREEVEALVEQQRQDPGQRPLQKRLAKEITTMVHSAEEYEAPWRLRRYFSATRPPTRYAKSTSARSSMCLPVCPSSRYRSRKSGTAYSLPTCSPTVPQCSPPRESCANLPRAAVSPSTRRRSPTPTPRPPRICCSTANTSSCRRAKRTISCSKPSDAAL